MALAVGSVISIDIFSIWQTQRIIFTTTYAVGANSFVGTDIANLMAIADEITLDANWGVPKAYKDCVGGDVVIQEARIQKVFPGRSSFVSFDPSFVTVANAQAEEGVTAAALTLVGALATRSNVGTKHIGPLPKDAHENGAFTTAFMGKLEDLAELLVVPIDAAATGTFLEPIIYRVSDNTSRIVWSYRLPDRVTTQRRRMLRAGV